MLTKAVDKLFFRVLGIIVAIFDSLLEENHNIVTPIEVQSKPRMFHGDIVDTW
jgi:hypothetical protein